MSIEKMKLKSKTIDSIEQDIDQKLYLNIQWTKKWLKIITFICFLILVCVIFLVGQATATSLNKSLIYMIDEDYYWTKYGTMHLSKSNIQIFDYKWLVTELMSSNPSRQANAESWYYRIENATGAVWK